MTTTLEVTAGATNLDDEVIRAEIWRTVNAAGRFNIICDNDGGALNTTFDVQDEVLIDINGTRIFEGWIDGPAVTLIGQDRGKTFRQLISLQGVDRAQDMMFHNDFDYFYPEWNTIGTRVQRLDDILGDLFIFPRITSNISYVVPGAPFTPNVGGFEFREGGNFLSAIQELHHRADYLFYVQDGIAAGFYPLQSFPPGGAPCGVIYSTTTAYHIIKYADLQERQGDKLHNWVKVYGKNPMFDAWLEYNSASWTATPAGQIADDAATVRVGTFSQLVYNNNPANSAVYHTLTCPIFNYPLNGWDFTKGQIGFWGYYDDNGIAPPTVGFPGVGAAGAIEYCEIILTDFSGAFVTFFGSGTVGGIGNTRLYEEEWGWCYAELGGEYDNTVANVANKWCQGGGATFDWGQVNQIDVRMPRDALVSWPSHFYIDGITLPIPPIAISTVGAGPYRRRPIVLNKPDIRTQHALDGYATAIRTHSDSTDVNYVKFMGVGHSAGGNVLRYGGQDFTLNIPEHGITSDTYYAVTIHHVCEPRQDVTDGYGYDYITEVEAIPVPEEGGVAYDSARLGYYAWMPPYRAAYHGSTGERMK